MHHVFRYTIERGAHSYWLNKGRGNKPIKGKHGIINLLHYDDAADVVIKALEYQSQPSSTSSTTRGCLFLASDGKPLSRIEICQAALTSSMYKNNEIPIFEETDSEPKKLSDNTNMLSSLSDLNAYGKVYDTKVTRKLLKWKPKYPSFRSYMKKS